MIFSFFHIWLASVEFRREKSSRWHVASNFLKKIIILLLYLHPRVRTTMCTKKIFTHHIRTKVTFGSVGSGQPCSPIRGGLTRSKSEGSGSGFDQSKGCKSSGSGGSGSRSYQSNMPLGIGICFRQDKQLTCCLKRFFTVSLTTG